MGEQGEGARFAKKLVKRELTRVVTPGTAMNAVILRSHENNYLAAVMVENMRAGMAHVDISTGEFRTTELDFDDVAASLETLNVREVLIPSGTAQKFPCLKTGG